MPTSIECICCREIDKVVQKKGENGIPVNCITEQCVPECMGIASSLLQL